MVWVRRYLRPLRVFLIAVLLGLAFGLLLRFVFHPLLDIMQQALFFRISKPLELIKGPLTGILGTEEAATAAYLLANNLLVSFISAFGGLLLVRFTMKRDDQPYSGGSRVTNFLHRLIGEGNETYMEHSVLIYLLPLAVVFVNGAVLGIFSVSQDLSWKEFSVYFAYILPHGVIELPAVILASTIGYSYALRLNGLLDANEVQSFFRSVDQILRSRRAWGLFSIVIIMIISAATIETYVTPAFGRNALRKAYYSLDALNNSVEPGQPAFAVLRAAFGSTITFHSGSSSGPRLSVVLVGSERFPFMVDGRLVTDSETIEASELVVLEDVAVLLLEFSIEDVTEPMVVYLVAQYKKLRSEANLTVEP